MPTNVYGMQPRQNDTQQINYLRRKIAHTDNGKTLEVGILPKGALILKPISGVDVSEVFDAGTGNVLTIGTKADPDLFATDLALGTVAFVPLDEAVSMRMAADTIVTTTVTLTGTAATAGTGDIVIAFLADNDG